MSRELVNMVRLADFGDIAQGRAEGQTLLKHDPSRPFLHLVGKKTDMVEFFNRNVLSAAWPGHHATAVERVKVDWTPGRKYAAVYELLLKDPAETPAVRAVLSFDEDDPKLSDVYAQHYAGKSEISVNGPLPALFLPDLQCLVEFFPCDWGLPSLAQVTSPDEILPFLAAALCSGSEPHRWRCNVSALRHTPHSRCVLLYEVQAQDSDDRREAIGKVYGNPTDAAKAFANNCGLHVAAAGQELIIPRPLAYADSFNLLLIERVRGVSMKELLRNGADSKLMARTAAATLSTLHSLPFEGREARSLNGDLKQLRRSADRMRPVAQELSSQVEALHDRVGRLMAKLKRARPCPIHGAFRPAHLIVENGDVALIDLDGAGLGDPAIDVAGFMSKCVTNTRTLAEDSRAELPEYFLAEYQARANADGDLADRARVYCGLTFVTRAVRAFLRAPYQNIGTRGPSRSSMFLKEAARWLDRVE